MQRGAQEIRFRKAATNALDVREAECFSEADRLNIMADISGREDVVNRMLQDLVFESNPGSLAPR